MAFVEVGGERGAGFFDRAAETDLSRALLALAAAAATLAGGCEEHGSVHTPAGALRLPFPAVEDRGGESFGHA
jgi:hypothetical protein